ncbi:hypothetical protein HU200_043745 [Digitaria exilis]|uniref:Uncharacterized protein n=1 Tax=Digitaria exilis TaxID=1010633 RepID=A0A835EFV8_9POAL|nr:hypothetical protein HU200_043745 [Digitaria exilis]
MRSMSSANAKMKSMTTSCSDAHLHYKRAMQALSFN